jgi:hypothetical protein
MLSPLIGLAKPEPTNTEPSRRFNCIALLTHMSASPGLRPANSLPR